MFKRPLSAKTSSPLRSSDLRKLRDEVARSFSLADTTATKALLPEGTLSCKATTHLDEPCTLYLAPGGDPRFFRVGKGSDGQLVPTCYAFDIRPDMLPVLATAEAVVENLVSGSGACQSILLRYPCLFLLLSRPHLPPLTFISILCLSIQPCSPPASLPSPSPACPTRFSPVRSSRSPSRPTRRSESSQSDSSAHRRRSSCECNRARKRGRARPSSPYIPTFLLFARSSTHPCLRQLHARRDYLWATGSAIDAPLPERSSEAASTDDSADDLADSLAASTLDESGASSKQPEGIEQSKDSAPSADLTPADVDQILMNALLLAISTSLSSAQFPFPASLLYSSHILPARPATLLSDSAGPAAAEIKKSSFKKLDRLIKAAVKKGYIAAKEVKGEWVVQSVNAKHTDVESLRPYKTLAGEEKAQAREAKKDEEKKASVEAGGNGDPEVTELWKLSGDSVKELFRSVEHER